MKATILFLFFSLTIGFTAFSQKTDPKKGSFELVSAHLVTLTKDSATTIFTGNVDIKGKTFHFKKAGKVVYNRNENTLLIYDCDNIEFADSICVIKGADGKKYYRYKL